MVMTNYAREVSEAELLLGEDIIMREEVVSSG